MEEELANLDLEEREEREGREEKLPRGTPGAKLQENNNAIDPGAVCCDKLCPKPREFLQPGGDGAKDRGTKTRNQVQIRYGEEKEENSSEDRRDEEDEDEEDEEEEMSSRFSGMLGVEFSTARSKSPVTVQEWVAALPDLPEETETNQPEPSGHQEMDNLRLGAEGNLSPS